MSSLCSLIILPSFVALTYDMFMSAVNLQIMIGPGTENVMTQHKSIFLKDKKETKQALKTLMSE